MEKFFFEKLLYSKCSFGRIECSFEGSTEKPNKTTEHICSKFENVRQLCCFSGKKHLFESSCGHVEGSFGKKLKKTQQNRIQLAQNHEVLRKHSKNGISQQIVPLHT